MQSIVREFVFIIFDRKGVFLLIFLSVSAMGIAAAILSPSTYKSTAKFSIIIPQSLDPLQKEYYYDYNKKAKDFMQSQKELILSNRVTFKVAEKFKPKKEKNLLEYVDKIYKKIEVNLSSDQTIGTGNFFSLSFNDGNPLQAYKFAKEIAATYLKAYNDMSKERSDYSYNFFKQQSEKLYQEMINKENALREYEKKQALVLIEFLNLESGKTNIEVGPTSILTQFTKKMYELQQELATLKITINKFENELEKKEIPAIPQEMEGAGRAISMYKSKVTQLQIQLSEMKPQFTDDFEPMQKLKKELNLNISLLKQEFGRTIETKKITADSIQTGILELEKNIQDLKKHIKNIAMEKSNYEHLKHEFSIAKESYVQILAQREQARLSQDLNYEKQYITLVDEPVAPVKPFKPNRKMMCIMGIFAGIMLGLSIALTLDFFDHSVKKIEYIENYFDVPLLGSIPKFNLNKN